MECVTFLAAASWTVRWCAGKKAQQSLRRSTHCTTGAGPTGTHNTACNWLLQKVLHSRANTEPDATVALLPRECDAMTLPCTLNDTRSTVNHAENQLTKANVLRVPRPLVAVTRTNKRNALATRSKAHTNPLVSGAFGDGICIVCADAQANATFVHGLTGHTACCVECADQLRKRGDTCPVCRQDITAVIRNFTV